MLQKTFPVIIVSLFFPLAACKENPADALARIESEWQIREAKIEQIKDEDTRKNFDRLAGFLHFMEKSGIEAQLPPTVTDYTDSELTRLYDYANAKEMAEVFAGAITVEDGYAGGLRPDLPFSYPFLHSLEWTSLTFSDGGELPIVAEYDPALDEIQVVQEGSGVQVVYDPTGAIPEGSAKPTLLKGVFETQLQGAPLVVKFAENQVGQTRLVGDYAVTLLKREGHLIAVEVSRIDGAKPEIETEAIYIEARDKTGRFLDYRSRGWGDPKEFALMIKAMDLAISKAISGEIKESDPDALMEIIAKTGNLKEPSKLYGEVDFEGTVQDVQVTILTPADANAFVQEIVVPVANSDLYINADEPPARNVAGPVYSHGIEKMLHELPNDLEPEEIQTMISLEHSDYDNVVHFNYPDVLSAIFIDGFSRFVDDEDQVLLTFLDASGAPVKSDGKGAYRFTINRIEYDPARFAIPLARVSGRVFVRRLKGVTRATYSEDTLPNGMRINGNMLLISKQEYTRWQSDYAVFAVDSKGRYLTMFDKKSLTVSTDEKFEVRYYYGDIAGIELFQRGETETLPFDFDIALKPVE